MKTNYLHLLTICLLLMGLSFSSCSEKSLEDDGNDSEMTTPDGDEEEVDVDTYNKNIITNYFACNVMNTYYLWVKEIQSDIDKWFDDFAKKEKIVNPIFTVERIRYKDTNGEDIDKWTYVTENATKKEESTQGYSKTYGFDFTLYREAVNSNYLVIAINYVFKDSPADKAGLRRGDVFYTINGNDITLENYKVFLEKAIYESPNITMGKANGSEIKMTAVDMYENPIHTSRVFDCGDKKVGYLHYTQFTIDSISDLYELAKEFKEKGISELILDLRYNPGGYVATALMLSSLLAPPSVAFDTTAVFYKSIQNELLSEAFKDSNTTYFTTKFSYTNHNNEAIEIDTKDANLDLKKLYVIYTGSSASASELTVTGLLPYMDIDIIGKPSYGKYCEGFMYTGKDWYEDYKSYNQDNQDLYVLSKEYIDDWGISVISGRFADKFGETPCMPNGFTPKYEVNDNPLEDYPIGDERELMLNKALQIAGKTDLKPRPEDAQSKSISSQMIPIDSRTYKKEPRYAIISKPDDIVLR